MYPHLIFGGEVISPDRLKSRAEGLADNLYRLGVRSDDVVALMLRNEPAFLEIVLACQILGAYFCPINWQFKAAEVRHVLTDSGASIVFVHADLFKEVEAPATFAGLSVVIVDVPLILQQQYAGGDPPLPTASGLHYSSLLGRLEGIGRPAVQPRGAMTYTSGSTGKPKGVVRLPPAADLAATALAKRRALGQLVFGVSASSIALLSAPLYHSAPLSYALFCAGEGATLFLESKFSPQSTLQTIHDEQITHAYLVPTMYQRLLRIPEKERMTFNLSSLQFVASTGSPCAPETKRAMIEWFGPVINESYASSETGYITFIGSEESLRRPGSVGKPALEAQVKILDEEGHELPPNAVGLIYARQPAYPDFTYKHNAQARASMERAGLVTVGDMGYRDADGYLYISDRKSDMVISGGVNIYPAEIEAVLNELPAVLDCAVFGIPDAEFGEALAAAIELHPEHSLTQAEVLTYLAPRLANYKLPKSIVFHDSLPREDSGKIFKRRLRAPYWVNAGRLI
jgi:long-chain acyl-CoA synthetase